MKLFTTNPRSWADLRATLESLQAWLTPQGSRRYAPINTGTITAAGASVTTLTVNHNRNLAAYHVLIAAPLIVTSSPGAKPTVSFDTVTPDSFRLIIYNPNAAAADVQIIYEIVAP